MSRVVRIASSLNPSVVRGDYSRLRFPSAGVDRIHQMVAFSAEVKPQCRSEAPIRQRGIGATMKNWIWAACLTLGLAAGAGVLHAQRAGSGSSGGTFKNEVTIRVENGVRIITSNGIPGHETGKFPGAGNPNRISAQHYEFRVPADPKPAAKTTALRMQPFGVAVNGVVFDPGADEWWNGDRSS